MAYFGFTDADYLFGFKVGASVGNAISLVAMELIRRACVRRPTASYSRRVFLLLVPLWLIALILSVASSCWFTSLRQLNCDTGLAFGFGVSTNATVLALWIIEGLRRLTGAVSRLRRRRW